MRTMLLKFSILLLLNSWTPLALADGLKDQSEKLKSEIPIGGFWDEMHAVHPLPATEGSDYRILFGDSTGRLRITRFIKNRAREEWISPPIQDVFFRKIDEGECVEYARLAITEVFVRLAITEVFVEDIDADGDLEFGAYSEYGGIILYNLEDYKELWRSSFCEFASLSGMVIANVDEDPQMELIFCGETVEDVKAYRQRRGIWPQEGEVSRLFVFDCLNLFMEWNIKGNRGIVGTSILVANLDEDEGLEIALNTGFVVDATMRQIEWEYPDGFGEKIGCVDLDNDGILELVGEYVSPVYPKTFLRFFDVDRQKENFVQQANTPKDEENNPER